MDKMTMELVWHNCVTCPPEEDSNDRLIMTDGKTVWPVEYDRPEGETEGDWFKDGTRSINVKARGKTYWWADMEQTVRGFFKK